MHLKMTLWGTDLEISTLQYLHSLGCDTVGDLLEWSEEDVNNLPKQYRGDVWRVWVELRQQFAVTQR